MDVLRFLWIRIKALRYQPCRSEVKEDVKNFPFTICIAPFFVFLSSVHPSLSLLIAAISCLSVCKTDLIFINDPTLGEVA
jgi:hypothetical protein